MKQDTKKILMVGGVALAALYAYSIVGGDEDYAGMGGGGGMPLLPGIPEAVAAAAPTIYNFPAMPSPEWDIESVKESVRPSAKKSEVAISDPIGAAITSDTKLYGGFTLPELKAAPFEFFESDVFAQQTGLMSRERTRSVVDDMLKESKKSGFIKQSNVREAANIRFDASKWTRGSSSLASRKEHFGGKSIYATQAGSTRQTPHSKKMSGSSV